MNALRLLLAAGTMTLMLTNFAPADDKKDATDNAKLLVGKWELTKAQEGLPVGTMFEFTKDGKLHVAAKKGEKEHNINAKYKVDGDKIQLVLLGDGKEDQKDPITIKTISDKELVLVGKDGGVFELKRAK